MSLLTFTKRLGARRIEPREPREPANNFFHCETVAGARLWTGVLQTGVLQFALQL